MGLAAILLPTLALASTVLGMCSHNSPTTILLSRSHRIRHMEVQKAWTMQLTTTRYRSMQYR